MGVLLNVFLCFFGLVIMASSINMPCVARNFFFILTGVGKGLFNIFVGTLLFLNEDGFNPSMFLGFAMIASGFVFLFLSYCKKMTDTDLQRATSLYGNELQVKAKTAAKNAAVNNKDAIGKAAVIIRKSLPTLFTIIMTPLSTWPSTAKTCLHKTILEGRTLLPVEASEVQFSSCKCKNTILFLNS